MVEFVEDLPLGPGGGGGVGCVLSVEELGAPSQTSSLLKVTG